MAFRETPATKVPAEVMVPRIVFLLAVLALVLIGLVMVYSASFVEAIHEGESSTSYLTRQFVYSLLGIAGAVFVWKVIPPRIWAGPVTYLFFAACFFLLVLTAAIGNEGLGAQRWIDIGPFSMQPSEFAKIAFVLVACKLLYDYQTGQVSTRAALVLLVVTIIFPILFLYKAQSDFGTTLIIAVGILAVLWLGEVPLRYLAVLCAFGLVAVFAAVFLVSYRADRFVFLNPWNDGEGGYGTGYQTIHSWYAFAEGGLFGVGLGNSHEKYLYLPEAETDFIFAVVGEELGMFGALLVIVFFLALLYSGLRIAKTAANEFSTMVAGSLTIMICFQAFLNIGCVLGLLPVTGKPLPFISSGGSSLIATLGMVGLILSVSKEASSDEAYARRRENLLVVHEEEPAAAPALSLSDFTARWTGGKERGDSAKASRKTSRARAVGAYDDYDTSEQIASDAPSTRRSETLGWGETFGLKSNRERMRERAGTSDSSDTDARTSRTQTRSRR